MNSTPPSTRLSATGSDADLGFRFQAMACDCEVRVAGFKRRQAEPLVRQAIAEVRRIESKFSRYLPHSAVSRINANAGSGQALKVDAETAQLLHFAQTLVRESGGLFDPTSGILRLAWDFRTGRKPEPGQLEALLPRIGWQHVDLRAHSIALTQPGMQLDFGGFGKEYAADRVATLLQEAGVRHGMVNLGGDVRVLGPQLGGEPWVIGIQHPREPRSLLARVPLLDGALATSGDYERSFVDADGQRFCHILDPRTGWPVQTWQSVSVLAPACLAAGAMSTIAMLQGERAKEFLESQHVAYLAVDRDGVRHEKTAPPSAQ